MLFRLLRLPKWCQRCLVVVRVIGRNISASRGNRGTVDGPLGARDIAVHRVREISRKTPIKTWIQPIFSYTHRETDFIEKYFVRVDMTEEFPSLGNQTIALL